MEIERLNYSIPEVADIWGISVHTVSRDIRLGRIEATRYGRRVLISREEILRIAKEGMPLPRQPK